VGQEKKPLSTIEFKKEKVPKISGQPQIKQSSFFSTTENGVEHISHKEKTGVVPNDGQRSNDTDNMKQGTESKTEAEREQGLVSTLSCEIDRFSVEMKRDREHTSPVKRLYSLELEEHWSCCSQTTIDYMRRPSVIDIKSSAIMQNERVTLSKSLDAIRDIKNASGFLQVPKPILTDVGGKSVTSRNFDTEKNSEMETETTAIQTSKETKEEDMELDVQISLCGSLLRRVDMRPKVCATISQFCDAIKHTYSSTGSAS
jgi:hypothetical protein